MTTNRNEDELDQAGDGSPGVPEGGERDGGEREPGSRGARQAAGDRTGTARRSAEAAGDPSDENNLADAERALRESRGQ